MTFAEFQNREFLVKREVAALLGCSEKSVQRLIAAGKLSVIRSGQFDAVKITCESLKTHVGADLPKLNFDPEPSAPLSGEHAPSGPGPEREPACPEHARQPVCPEQTRPVDPIEQQRLSDFEFAERYKRGEVTDSSGNRIGEPTKSLLGPIQAQERRRPSATAHMDQALLPNVDAPPNVIDTDDYLELRHPGHKDRQRAMYQGMRRASEQEKKQALDFAAIQQAFREGYSR
jgi:hypothetical protein